MKRMSMILAAALCAAVASGPAPGQSFPSKPVRIVVAFPAGGGTDIVARIVGHNLAELWGQQVLVENRAGASGVIGTEIAARAAADGYTLFMGTLGNFSVNPHLYPRMSVDPVRDFAPITQVVDVHFGLYVHPSLPANNVAELIALARSKPGGLHYASSGPGGAPHLAAELFKRMAGVDIVHVPYKGSAPSMQDVIGGQVTMTFDSLIQALPHIRDRRLKALAVLGKSRSAQLPEVPTVDESGLPGYELTNWFGLAAPAATPKEIVARHHADVVRVLLAPEVREKITAMAATVVGNSSEEFGERVRGDSAKWARLIKEANIKAE
jgi:tripartite-type tricarboxylate transporter receptor subunit TctC